MAVVDKISNSYHKILIVDDNLDLASVTGMLLNFLGFQVQTCNTGKDCIRLAQQMQPDVILLDIDMPIMNGYQVCEHIRNQSWGRYLSIIAYTGRDSPSTSKDALATGF
ncbi:response regulator, partial [Dyadobacter sediminis]